LRSSSSTATPATAATSVTFKNAEAEVRLTLELWHGSYLISVVDAGNGMEETRLLAELFDSFVIPHFIDFILCGVFAGQNSWICLTTGPISSEEFRNVIRVVHILGVEKFRFFVACLS
jgi:hypothetical protein